MDAVVVEASRSGRQLARRLVALVLTAASLAGAVLAVDTLRGHNSLVGSSASATEPVIHVIGEDVATSFGVVAVENASATIGLGVAGPVVTGSIDVQVAAVITNLTDHALAYQPTQFDLIDNAGNVVPISKAPQLPEELQPLAAVEVLIDFATTTAARPFKVRFVDPATSETILVDLGAVGCTVRSGAGGPRLVAGGCGETPQDDNTNS